MVNDYQQPQLLAEDDPAISKVSSHSLEGRALYSFEKGPRCNCFAKYFILLDQNLCSCRPSQRHQVMFQSCSGVSKQYLLDLHNIKLMFSVESLS